MKIKTKFKTQGKPMNALQRVKPGVRVLVAHKTVVYDSGPSAHVEIGYWDGKYIKVTSNSHAMPVTSFQRWWHLPYAQFVTVSL